MNLFTDKFDMIATQYPDSIAIEDCGSNFTYDQLRLKALGFACLLQNEGVQKGDVIILRMNKSAEYIAVLLSCWYVGAVFLPLDPKLPDLRTKYILDDSGAKFLIGIPTNFNSSIRFLELEEMDFALSPLDINPQDSAYLIYTSGSTGNPKGVDLSHAGLVPMLNDQIKAFDMNNDSRSLFMLSISFDASLSDIGTALLSGATLVIEPPCRLQAFQIFDTIERCEISYIDMPPSILTQLDPKDKPESLKTIVIGGEVCPDKTIRKWASEVNLVNVYGPTEATICTSLVKCTIDWDKALIGQPLSSVKYLVSDEGELLISGLCLAKEYINQPELTDNKFINIDNERWYRTGDRVELLVDGDYLFIGRLDQQVKLRGRLIELGEVEEAINKLEYVKDCFVCKYVGEGAERLVACIETETYQGQTIRDFLKTRLPTWMIPTQMICMSQLPRNNSNKIDSSALIEVIKAKSWQNDNSLEGIFFSYTGEAFPEDSAFVDVGIDSFGLMEISMAALDQNITLSPSLIAESRNLKDLKRKLKMGETSSSMDAESLREDANRELRKIRFPSLADFKESSENSILVTGASGLLGNEVLLKLLASTNVQIYCLIRCKSEREGWERLHLRNADLIKYENRIKIVSGDLEKPDLGIESNIYSELIDQVGTVYHCAANVNSLKSYEELCSVNVKGVAKVLKFCLEGNYKKLNYASTLSVFVSSDKNKGVLKEDDDLSSINKLYGGYSQSKFCAEILLQMAQKLYPAINIFRFGLITPPSNKSFNTPEDFLQMFIKETLLVACRPEIPPENVEVDITPLDFAAQAFVDIGEQSKGASHSWHIANERSLSLQELYNEIEKVVPLEKLSFSEWSKRVIESSVKGSSLLTLCRLREDFEQLRTMDLFQASGVLFDMQRSLEILNEKGTQIPEINSSLIQKYIAGVQCS